MPYIDTACIYAQALKPAPPCPTHGPDEVRHRREPKRRRIGRWRNMESETMRKKWFIGTQEAGEYYSLRGGKKRGALHVAVEVEIQAKPKGLTLSICGTTYYPGERDIRGGGQCVEELAQVVNFADGFNAEKVARLAEIWDRWHLNDMRAGCEHQRAGGFDTGKAVTVIGWTWGDAFHSLRRLVEDGKATPDNYKKYQDMIPRVYAVCNNTDHPQWESPAALELEAGGWVKRGKTKQERAGWVLFNRHPEGLLCRPCAHCGYRYGSQWMHEELPQSVIDELVAMLPGLEVPELATA